VEPRLSLLVIRSSDLEKSRRFYEAIGLAFIEEQHGKGPLHLACELGDVVLEIYALDSDSQATKQVRFGLRVADLDGALAALEAGGASPRTAAKESRWGRRAVICDPDGHTIELLG
jgi:lactoylglutathione lyase